jgi:hypothetical protein
MPMREPKPKPLSPMQQKKLDKMMAVARGTKVDPMDYMRSKPKRKKGSMDNDLRQMGPRKPPAKTMPKRIGGAVIEKPAKRVKPMPKRIGKPASKRIGKVMVPKAKKMGY